MGKASDFLTLCTKLHAIPALDIDWTSQTSVLTSYSMMETPLSQLLRNVAYYFCVGHLIAQSCFNFLLWLWCGFERGLTFESSRPVGVMGIQLIQTTADPVKCSWEASGSSSIGLSLCVMWVAYNGTVRRFMLQDMFSLCAQTHSWLWWNLIGGFLFLDS